MASLIKMGANRQSLYLRGEWHPGVVVGMTANYLGVVLSNPVVEALNGKEPSMEDGILKANQNVRLSFGTIHPAKYEVLLAINPELCRTCNVSNPGILRSGDEPVDFGFTMTTLRNTDLSKLSWIVTLYLID